MQNEKIFIFHSRDDKVVPFKNIEEISRILPNAEKNIFEDRGHFLGEKFPEIIKKIRSL